MSWQKKLSCSFVFCALVGCGVKGDPLPPERPPEIGRGRPTYKSAVEDIKVEKAVPRKKVQPAKPDTEDDDDEQE